MKSIAKRRTLFLLLAAVLLLAGVYTGEKIYFLALYVMAGMAAVSIVTALVTYARLNYLQTLEPSAGIKGENVRLTIEIHNDYLFPFPLVVVEYDLPEDWLTGKAPVDAAAVLPRSRHTIERTVRCRFRGRFPVGLKRARFADLFGLFAFTIRFERMPYHKKLTLLVRPRVVPLPYLPLPSRESEGQVRSRLRASQDLSQMSDPRKYLPGDPLKKVHWKLTMRSREIMVKNYEQSDLPQVMLYVDIRKTGLPGAEGVALEDMVIECAAAVAYHVLEKGFPLRLVAYGARRTQLDGARASDFPVMYGFLSEAAFEGDLPIRDVLSWESRQTARQECLFIIAQDLTGSAFDLLMQLRHTGAAITYILVRPAGKAMDEDTGRMIAEMRGSRIPVLAVTPLDDLAGKAEALR